MPLDVDPDDAWFVYTRSSGRVTAIPANAKGWAALIASCIATICLTLIMGRWAFAIHPLMAALALPVSLVAGLLLIVRLVLAKGRLSP